MTDQGSIRRKCSIRWISILLATWFGFGLLPRAPGTWGALAALPIAWLIHMHSGPRGLFCATVLLFLIGIWAAGVYARDLGNTDPSQVVIDEVSGQWLTIALACPLDPQFYIAGFIIFRVFDIFKPWPVSWADHHLKGGLGIMVDDIIAALYAAGTMVILGYIAGVY